MPDGMKKHKAMSGMSARPTNNAKHKTPTGRLKNGFLTKPFQTAYPLFRAFQKYRHTKAGKAKTKYRQTVTA